VGIELLAPILHPSLSETVWSLPLRVEILSLPLGLGLIHDTWFWQWIIYRSRDLQYTCSLHLCHGHCYHNMALITCSPRRRTMSFSSGILAGRCVAWVRASHWA
jgi:hypothetical protein